MGLRWRKWKGWRFHIGWLATVIRREGRDSGPTIIVEHWAMTGVDRKDFKAAQPSETEYGGWHKGAAAGMVKPGHVKDWLKRHRFVGGR